jgi:hypothetical protein
MDLLRQRYAIDQHENKRLNHLMDASQVTTGNISTSCMSRDERDIRTQLKTFSNMQITLAKTPIGND